MSATVGLRDAAIGNIVRTKVKRYWPGMAPEWAAETTDDDLDLRRTIHVALGKNFRGLLAETRALIAEELPAGSRPILQADIVSTAEEENDEAQDARRRRIRERHLLREWEEEEELLPEEDEEPVAEDEVASQYDTGSEYEGMVTETVKPTFMPKPLRDTIAERE